MNVMAQPKTIPAISADKSSSTAKHWPIVPDSAPMPDLRGSAAVYHYHNAEGALSFIIARFERDGKKVVIPHTLWRDRDRWTWVRKMYDGIRPLYNLLGLLEATELPVLVSEGEKCSNALASLPSYVSVTWSGGCNAITKTDFTPLKGRDVIILPDDDKSGAKAAENLTQLLSEIGAASVRTFNIGALADEFGAERSQGFDIADAVAAGMTNDDVIDAISRLSPPQRRTAIIAPKMLAELEKAFTVRPQIPEGFEMTDDGVFKLGTDRSGKPTGLFIGSPLIVLDLTRAATGNREWGYRIAVRTPLSHWETVHVPNKLLAGDGRECRETLANAGCMLPQQPDARRALSEYISASRICPVRNVAARPGWHGTTFALPDAIISPTGDPELSLDMSDREHCLGTAGTLAAWQEMAALAAPNSRVTLAICAAFAAPLLRKLSIEGGGFHFYGRSTRGKTTLLILAASVWGGKNQQHGAVRQWRSTDNGIEGVVADHNDLLLCLDEMTLASPELVSDMLYMLANGHGKARAKKDGSSAKSSQWSTLVLSSGEQSTSEKLDIGRGKVRHTGGMSVRMVDIPVITHDEQSFEAHPKFVSAGAYADHLRSVALSNYGHPGRTFLSAFVDDLESMIAKAYKYIDWFVPMLLSENDDPQVARVARRFALVGAAGFLAADTKVLPIARENIATAVHTCFNDWKTARGGGHSEERRAALRDLRHFFEAHGATRFERLVRAKNTDADGERTDDFSIRDRCGYRIEQEDGSWLYYVLPAAWERDICGQHAHELVTRITIESGALERGEGHHIKKKARLPDYPNGTRVYAIRPDLLPEA